MGAAVVRRVLAGRRELALSDQHRGSASEVIRPEYGVGDEGFDDRATDIAGGEERGEGQEGTEEEKDEEVEESCQIARSKEADRGGGQGA